MRPPHLFSLVCVQYNTQKLKSGEKWGRPGNTYHVNDVRWTGGGQRGEMVHTHANNMLDFIIQ